MNLPLHRSPWSDLIAYLSFALFCVFKLNAEYPFQMIAVTGQMKCQRIQMNAIPRQIEAAIVKMKRMNGMVDNLQSLTNELKRGIGGASSIMLQPS